MPRNPSYSRARLQRGASASSSQGRLPKNYGSLQTGKFRHEATFDVPQVGNTTMLGIGDYFLVENLRFLKGQER